MDQLDFIAPDRLVEFFHCSKTEISCTEEPHIFLSQLRDHDLVPEDLYQEVIKRKSKKEIQKGVYEILDLVEKNGGDDVKKFWKCVFQEFIQKTYPVFDKLQRNLQDGQSLHHFTFLFISSRITLLDYRKDFCPSILKAVETLDLGSFNKFVKLPDAEKPTRNTDGEKEGKKQEQMKDTGKKTDKKIKKDNPGPSSGSRQKKPAKESISSLLYKKKMIPVTCGEKKGKLYRSKLAKGEKCILSRGQWFTPVEFERMAGKGDSKNWKLSIRYENIPLQKLIKEGYLKCPRKYK